ncbi:MAG: D-glycero-beta-D-manno-heptose 1,7-bisphosphate 7-phosphatase [Neisseria sp.]|nr:D-glycero-beta-D-manno-heptose 1,7-bisphosphate 7-phosphatase [Neisseria sp.]
MKLIILDRDGVINQDRDDYVKSADEWQPLEGSMDAIAFLAQAGYTIAVATNQSGIGRGLYTMQELTEMHAKMHKLVQQAGGQIDGIWFCPHTDKDGCNCRKPKSGMVEDILDRFNSMGETVYMVGDSLRDLQAAEAAGCRPVLVLTGKGGKTLSLPEGSLPETTLIFNNLLDFSQFLMRQNQNQETEATHAADS